MDLDLIKQLEEILIKKNDIVYGTGAPVNIAYECRKKEYSTSNILIFLNKNKSIAIIWNLKRQRDSNHIIKTQSLTSCSWENVLPVNNEIKDWYRKIGNISDNPYEKVLAMNFNTLIANVNDLYQLLEFDITDTSIPRELIVKEKLKNESRTKRTIEQWNRDVRFRSVVLEAYGKQCAICRCKEEKILEAAHIKAVSEGGNDKEENGICLCRNHHKMFDEGLIKIDFENLELKYIADSVQSMAWYKEFIIKYNKKILGTCSSRSL